MRDFAHFLNHWLHHRLPWLWPLHAVHHSAEVLTPLTLYRKHPLYDLVKHGVEAPLVGGFQGVTLYAFGNHLEVWEVAGVNAFYGLFLLAGSNLRHSHVWWSWGPLERLFVSPALHQIHHSIDPAHHNRNFGSVLSIWDAIFGSRLIPDAPMELEFGLGESQQHPGLRAAWWRPLAQIGDHLRRR